jgi:hypothetical protein
MVGWCKCDSCIHKHKEKIDGWIPCCDAFPNGWPKGWMKVDVEELKECNGNGYHYELDPDW